MPKVKSMAKASMANLTKTTGRGKRFVTKGRMNAIIGPRRFRVGAYSSGTKNGYKRIF